MDIVAGISGGGTSEITASVWPPKMSIYMRKDYPQD
jgi:hypothetical protein